MRFQNGCNKVAIELRVMQFWSEIILVISNRMSTQRKFDFEIMRMISDQIALSSITIINIPVLALFSCWLIYVWFTTFIKTCPNKFQSCHQNFSFLVDPTWTHLDWWLAFSTKFPRDYIFSQTRSSVGLPSLVYIDNNKRQ